MSHHRHESSEGSNCCVLNLARTSEGAVGLQAVLIPTDSLVPEAEKCPRMPNIQITPHAGHVIVGVLWFLELH